METISLAYLAAITGNYTESSDISTILTSELEKTYGSGKVHVTKDGSTYKISITGKGEYTIDANGKVEKTTGIFIETPAKTKILPDETLQLTAKLLEITGTIQWSSSNDNVATITGNNTSAIITGVAKGSTTITAQIDNDHKATIVIKVKRENEGLTEAELNALPNGVEELEDEDIPSYLKTDGELKSNIKAVITGNVAIPVGFFYVGGTKDEGVVISDNSVDSGRGTSHEAVPNFVGNQFVWVPVDNSSEFVRYEGYYNGSLESNQSWFDFNNCYEPSQTGYQYSTEVTEYTAMYNSVTGNKGFYVARYETSSSTNSSDGNAESKGNKTPWTSIAWGEDMTTIGTSGAIYKSKQMYTNRETYGVTSTLIYGAQWDAIMTWIDPAYKTGTCVVDDDSTNNIEKSYVANSEGKGYYKTATVTPSAKTNTASNSNYAIKNIYDLAGNVFEWTMEAYTTNNRVFRRRRLQ